MGHFEDRSPDVKCQTRNLGHPNGSNCEVEGGKKKKKKEARRALVGLELVHNQRE